MDLNIIENYYSNSKVAEELLKADIEIDAQGGIGHVNSLNAREAAQQLQNALKSKSRKRSREEFKSEDRMKFFQVVVKEYDYAHLFPVFKVYLDKKFNILLAKILQYDKETDYTAVLQNVTKFRDILHHAEKYFQTEQYQHVYTLLSETMFHHLLVSKGMIFAFNQGASRVLSHFE